MATLSPSSRRSRQSSTSLEDVEPRQVAEDASAKSRRASAMSPMEGSGPAHKQVGPGARVGEGEERGDVSSKVCAHSCTVSPLYGLCRALWLTCSRRSAHKAISAISTLGASPGQCRALMSPGADPAPGELEHAKASRGRVRGVRHPARREARRRAAPRRTTVRNFIEPRTSNHKPTAPSGESHDNLLIPPGLASGR